MHGCRGDGCCCVCVTQIGLFIRYKSNINIAHPCQSSQSAPASPSPRHWGPTLVTGPLCSGHWPVPLHWTLGISNKTRIQIKWAEIWCNYSNATLCHKTKEKFFIAAVRGMRSWWREQEVFLAPHSIYLLCLSQLSKKFALNFHLKFWLSSPSPVPNPSPKSRSKIQVQNPGPNSMSQIPNPKSRGKGTGADTIIL